MIERRRYRCAIYTRKSTEDGLEQDFNSLDAQREACSAYILSQASEGWEQIDTVYSDGGFSGGTMERPALKRLLDDLKSHKIDIIVVYKVDRLTRSLADFARLVELMDAQSASFVSVTQSFNTTTSMGRLTLNVLLSFAQFEREVTSERIRDKVAASKRKGMWMGGNIPAGYEVKDRKLVVVNEEAKLVEHIFGRYLELKSVPSLKDELQRQGIYSPERKSRSGKTTGGKPFTNGALYHLLTNPIFIGKVRHQDKLYEGQHRAILSADLFEQVQAQLEANRRARHNREGVAAPSLFAGLLVDGLGRAMSPSRTSKRGKAYRYYVSHTGEGDISRHGKWRAPAAELEEIVIGRLVDYLGSSEHLENVADDLSADELEDVLRCRALDAEALQSDDPQAALKVLAQWVDRVCLEESKIKIQLKDKPKSSDAKDAPAKLSIDASIVRSGRRTRIAIAPTQTAKVRLRDDALIKLIAKAWKARSAVEGSNQHLHEIASSQGHDPQYFGRLVRLGYLAPDIIVSILEGRQPAILTRQKLARTSNIPLCWQRQRELLGFSSAT